MKNRVTLKDLMNEGRNRCEAQAVLQAFNANRLALKIGPLISAKAGKGKPPPGMTRERWQKMGQNLRRAERLTGIAPVSGDGWETVAVILMDLLEKNRATPLRDR